MSKIHQVAGWPAGFWSSLDGPRIMFVWANSPREALHVANMMWRQKGVKIRASTSCIAKDQDLSMYEAETHQIVNLPMQELRSAWEMNKTPKSCQGMRPIYCLLPAKAC